jgi:hypothetical protein
MTSIIFQTNPLTSANLTIGVNQGGLFVRGPNGMQTLQ